MHRKSSIDASDVITEFLLGVICFMSSTTDITFILIISNVIHPNKHISLRLWSWCALAWCSGHPWCIISCNMTRHIVRSNLKTGRILCVFGVLLHLLWWPLGAHPSSSTHGHAQDSPEENWVTCLMAISQWLTLSFLYVIVYSYATGSPWPCPYWISALCLMFPLNFILLVMKYFSNVILGHIKFESFRVLKMLPGPLPSTG